MRSGADCGCNSVVIQAVAGGLKALSSKYLLRMLSKLNTVQSRSKVFENEANMGHGVQIIP